MTNPEYWQILGFTGQGVFTARFLVQWIASEKKRDSVVPVAFWWLSLLGGFTLMSYAIYRRDPVFVVGQGMGLVIYVRNLMIVGRKKRRESSLAGRVGVRADRPLVEERLRLG
ncbi:lipid-A-disaccharide synthase N-terminal domain-containing protein [Tundrisphaera lichenicola]|uniref:lipid-A-disaccharide synthase N-terminal domain-containing protein n=1 Tax=Tundrisphaera lichenicola TaxID=2029860 RepID=UPI003EBF0EF6